MIAKLQFHDLEIKTILWVYEYEKTVRTFYVDIELYLDIGDSYKTDELSDTINSWDIKNLVVNLVKGKDYNLLEKICYDITHSVKSYDSRISSVKTTVNKSWCIDWVQCVSCTLELK